MCVYDKDLARTKHIKRIGRQVEDGPEQKDYLELSEVAVWVIFQRDYFAGEDRVIHRWM